MTPSLPAARSRSSSQRKSETYPDEHLAQLSALAHDVPHSPLFPLSNASHVQPTLLDSRRGRAHAKEADATIAALNWLSLGRSAKPVPCNFSPEQKSAVERVVERASELASPLGCKYGNDALTALLAARAAPMYDVTSSGCGSAQGSLAPYRRSRVARPDSVSGAPRLRDVIADGARGYLSGNYERMLLDDATVSELNDILGPPGMYVDGVLKKSPRHYYRFIRDLCDSKLFKVTTKPSEMAGVFFVLKKDGTVSSNRDLDA